jgi:uncharacterized protein (TIGR00369 family)
MADPTDIMAEIARRMSVETPQAAALGIELVSVEPGKAAMRFPWREELVGDPATGVLAGGAVTTLLDHVCGLAAASTGLSRTATLDLRIDYMRAAKPRQAVTGQAHCYKKTRTIAFIRAVAFDDDPDDPVATAQAAFVLNGAPFPGAAP